MATAVGYLDARPVAQVRDRRRARSRRSFALLAMLASLAGLLLSLTPIGMLGEARFGAHWLFAARGEVAPPDEVVIVDIDRASARALDEGDRPRLWSRHRHAQLVRALARAGASVIAFDLVWPDPHTHAEDADFAAAIRESGNVVLVGELDREQDVPHGIIQERLTPPAGNIGRDALAVVPWPLPQANARVARFWTFKASAGDVPTLPAAMLYAHAAEHMPALAELLDDIHPALATALRAELAESESLLHLARDLRAAFTTHAADTRAIAAGIEASPHGFATRQRLHALLSLLGDDATRHFNLYGGPRSIRTVSYADLVCDCDNEALLASLRGKAVFVGVAAPHQPVLGDVFDTAFTTRDGGRLSGVELGATAFANLLERRTVRSAHWGVWAGTVIGVGVLSALLAWFVPLGWLVLAFTSLAALVFTGGAWAFSQHALQLPVTVPLAAQLPLALGLGLALRYRYTRKERSAMRRALGYYLPGRVAESVGDTVDDLGTLDELVHCVCLSSDAANFTRATEVMPPADAKDFVNSYYAELFAAVREHGGFVSDVVGDAMLALWPSNARDPALELKACLAAIDIDRRIRKAQALGEGMHTRIGIHSGRLVLGHVGAGEHFEFRAVGDIVNTTSRLEALNKRFATRAIVSHDVVAGQTQLLTRRLGRFALRGKREALVLHELLGTRDAASAAEQRLCRDFAHALTELELNRRDRCERRALALLARHPDDRPARLLLALARGEGEDRFEDGVIRLAA